MMKPLILGLLFLFFSLQSIGQTDLSLKLGLGGSQLIEYNEYFESYGNERAVLPFFSLGAAFEHTIKGKLRLGLEPGVYQLNGQFENGRQVSILDEDGNTVEIYEQYLRQQKLTYASNSTYLRYSFGKFSTHLGFQLAYLIDAQSREKPEESAPLGTYQEKYKRFENTKYSSFDGGIIFGVQYDLTPRWSLEFLVRTMNAIYRDDNVSLRESDPVIRTRYRAFGVKYRLNLGKDDA